MHRRFAHLGLVLTLTSLPFLSQASLTESGLMIAPYIQHVGKHAASILARSTAATELTLRYRKVGAANWHTMTEQADTTEHRFRLTDLKRGESYEYYLKNASGDHLSQTLTFNTQKDITNDNPLRIAVWGDSGVGSAAQYEVASEITSWQPELLLTTGDNAYSSGTETEYINYVFNVYSNLFSTVPYYPSMGNHDYTTDAGGPMKALFELPTKNSGTEDYYSFNYDNIHFVALNPNLPYSLGSAQYNWVNQDLSDTHKKWVIAYFHQPPYSSGLEHGSTADMADTLVPLFETYDVDLVLNGHDHDYERFEPINGVQYIVTGGGGNELYHEGTALDTSALFAATYHFVGLMISNDKIEIQAVDDTGFVFDEVTLE